MQIYVQHGGQQLGPFTEAELQAQIASGAISPQDHVWWQGQANWIPLSQSQFAVPGTATPVVPGAPAGPTTVVVAPPSSNLAVWALVCGCVSILCWLLASIPAIILGHMARSQIKKNPGMQGGGMALAGLILGYVTLVFSILYISVVGVSVLIALGNQVKSVNQTIQSQIQSAESTNSDSNSTDQSASTNSDQSTNAPAATSPDQSTNSDQSTNAAPSTTPASSDSSTNSSDSSSSSTNSTPAMNQ